jgi:hypothetical protein
LDLFNSDSTDCGGGLWRLMLKMGDCFFSSTFYMPTMLIIWTPRWSTMYIETEWVRPLINWTLFN